MIQSTAAVFTEPNQPLQLRSIRVPELKPGETLVRVECCTICSSDLHSFYGRRKCPTNTILGHEIVGVIQSASHDLEPDGNGNVLNIGDRVVFSIVVSCDRCPPCKLALPQKCHELFKYGHQPSTDEAPLSGGLSEFIVLRKGTNMFKVDKSLPVELVAPISCAGATAMAAYRSVSGAVGRPVIIVGCGMLGVFTCLLAPRDCPRLIAIDLNVHRAHLFTQLGATRAYGDLQDFAADNKQQPIGSGAIIFETSGNNDAIEQAVELLSPGGELVLIGSVKPVAPIKINPEKIVRGLNKMVGIHNYTPCDLAQVVNRLPDLIQRLAPVSSKIISFPLSDINHAIGTANSGRYLRVAVLP